MTHFNPLQALSPLDGRYQKSIKDVGLLFSEYQFLKYRLYVEIKWFEYILDLKFVIPTLKPSSRIKAFLEQILTSFTLNEAKKIKSIEKKTNHDIKAIEYYLKKQFSKNKALKPYVEFIHIGCTSEDINNVAYALMVKEFQHSILSPTLDSILQQLISFSHEHASRSMLSRTHGQPASPTTLGKEFANFAHRLKRQKKQLTQIEFSGKFNGAVGNYNALSFAYPNTPWDTIAKNFIESLDLCFNPYSTQVASYDDLSEYFHNLIRINTILIDFVQDIWLYTTLGYLKIQSKSGEIGSSTMPHKTNPINFENAEGNFHQANNLLNFLAMRLPISRLQRDLSNSTLLRNIGVSLGHMILGLRSLTQGLSKLRVEQSAIEKDLSSHLNVLSEAVQTELRKHGVEKPYEQLKKLTERKEGFNIDRLQLLLKKLPLPEESRQKIQQLSPQGYIGLAKKLALKI